MISEDVYLNNILTASGWNEGRRLERQDIARLIEQEGYAKFPKVLDFLEQFIDLKIVFENKRNNLKHDDINFSLSEATHLEVPERINVDYAKRTGKQLCLIGSAYREHMVLLMAADGSVYGAYDNFLCKISDSGLGAIKAIIYDYDFEQIP